MTGRLERALDEARAALEASREVEHACRDSQVRLHRVIASLEVELEIELEAEVSA